MPVAFLSDEYMEAATAALNDDADLASKIEGVSLGLQFRVTDPPDSSDPILYYLQISSGQVTMAHGGLDDPDVRITNSYETAAGLAKEEIKDQIAFLTGKLKIAGNMARLMANMGTFMQIRRVLQGIDITY